MAPSFRITKENKDGWGSTCLTGLICHVIYCYAFNTCKSSSEVCSRALLLSGVGIFIPIERDHRSSLALVEEGHQGNGEVIQFKVTAKCMLFKKEDS